MLGTSLEVLLVQLQVCDGGRVPHSPEQPLSCLVLGPSWALGWAAAPSLGVAGCCSRASLSLHCGAAPAAGGRHFTGTVLETIMLL